MKRLRGAAMYMRPLVLGIFARQRPIQGRAGDAPTTIAGVGVILPKLRRPAERGSAADRQSRRNRGKHRHEGRRAEKISSAARRLGTRNRSAPWSPDVSSRKPGLHAKPPRLARRSRLRGERPPVSTFKRTEADEPRLGVGEEKAGEGDSTRGRMGEQLA